ncbi:MAG: hypothetical protein JO197_04540 [Acidobacteria bacterium]|nr:hypothetical protein [Acidobacteriota bacterium]MBV9475278.1 hypothetical protein [Acidobacteriota bacterium]
MSLSFISAAVPPEFREFPTAFPQAFAQRFCADFLTKSGSSPHALHAFFTHFFTMRGGAGFQQDSRSRSAGAAAEKRAKSKRQPRICGKPEGRAEGHY